MGAEAFEVAEGVEQALSVDPRLPAAKYFELGAWRDRAVCRSMGPTMFFGVNQPGLSRKAEVAEAIAVCKTCPVRKECFNYAKQNDERFGVWGGVDFFLSSKRKYPRIIPDSID